MKINRLFVMLALVSTFMLSSCSYRLVDFTAISSKNLSLPIDKTKGVKTEGKVSYFLGIGYNLKDALDKALNEAGPGYDLLVDGVVRVIDYPFVLVVKVEGLAINTNDMKTSMTEEEYNTWLASQNTFDKNNPVVVEE
jgi:hypothetical protein